MIISNTLDLWQQATTMRAPAFVCVYGITRTQNSRPIDKISIRHKVFNITRQRQQKHMRHFHRKGMSITEKEKEIAVRRRTSVMITGGYKYDCVLTTVAPFVFMAYVAQNV